MRNRFFNQYETATEQNVLEDLIIESLKIYGINGYYLPRTHVNLDMLFKEDASMKFDDALEIEMYLKTYDDTWGKEILFRNLVYKSTNHLHLRFHKKDLIKYCNQN